MKKHLLLSCLLFFVACTPVKVTKEYYEDYVNPKPSIDYENTVSTELPAEFLDDYYTIDSKIVRLVDQIDLMDSQLDASWIEGQKSAHPWIRHMAVLDQELLLITGDDTLGFDPHIRDSLAGKTTEARRFCITSNDRVMLVHVADAGNAKFRTTLVEIDMALLAADVPGSRTSLVTGDQVHGGTAVPADTLADIEKSTSYAGQAGLGERDLYWIRSMASDNLVYVYSN